MLNDTLNGTKHMKSLSLVKVVNYTSTTCIPLYSVCAPDMKTHSVEQMDHAHFIHTRHTSAV